MIKYFQMYVSDIKALYDYTDTFAHCYEASNPPELEDSQKISIKVDPVENRISLDFSSTKRKIFEYFEQDILMLSCTVADISNPSDVIAFASRFEYNKDQKLIDTYFQPDLSGQEIDQDDIDRMCDFFKGNLSGNFLITLSIRFGDLEELQKTNRNPVRKITNHIFQKDGYVFNIEANDFSEMIAIEVEVPMTRKKDEEYSEFIGSNQKPMLICNHRTYKPAFTRVYMYGDSEIMARLRSKIINKKDYPFIAKAIRNGEYEVELR